MEACSGTEAGRILSDPGLQVGQKVQEFIRYYNRARGSGADSWQVSKDEWQRYEFLGDRVLNLVAAGLLYGQSPPCREGVMSPMMGVVSNESLSAIAGRRGIDITRLVPAAIGQQHAYGDAIRGGAIEACIGAMYIAAGFEATRVFVCDLLTGEIEQYDPSLNYKGRLQEYYQQIHMEKPEYREESRTGPENKRVYTCSVRDPDGRLLGTGTGSSLTKAEQAAAQEALRFLNIV